MTRPDHATTVASLLEASATLPGEARLRFLQRACGGDSALLEELESLLDALEAGPVPAEASTVQTGLVSRDQVLNAIDEEVQKLPGRQREAFLLRYWQDMDVAETAAIMGCSEGSVKTHCSRATHTLAHALKSRGIRL